MTYYDFVKNYMGVTSCTNIKKYSSIGHSFYLDKKDMEGIYWFYETDNFIIDIHDFYIKDEIIEENTYTINDYMSIYSAYIISANGENFNPYQTILPNTLYTLDLDNIENNYRFLLHKNSYYLGVAIGFKKEIINNYLSTLKIPAESFYNDLFLNNKAILTKSLEPIAMDILNCKMESPAAEMFFQAKANEWMSLIIDAFLSRKDITISPDDDKALINVASYLDDHYAINVKQNTLEKISMMSGTKLKNLFKNKYQMTITEYTQRKRINMAETLLINSTLSIKEIAKSVGYLSHSKFSSYFKKYKGVYPKDIRKLAEKENQILECSKCNGELHH